MLKNNSPGMEKIVDSPLGARYPDSGGSPVGVVRMDPERSYAGIDLLLQETINREDGSAWDKIKAKIDYTYENLDMALAPLEAKTGFEVEIRARMERGQKLLFKPNLVNPLCIHPQTHGPAMGSTACTEWPFMAALMRWFHDKLNISYYQMAVGEAATVMTAAAKLLSRLNPEGREFTPEAVIEGKSGDSLGVGVSISCADIWLTPLDPMMGMIP